MKEQGRAAASGGPGPGQARRQKDRQLMHNGRTASGTMADQDFNDKYANIERTAGEGKHNTWRRPYREAGAKGLIGWPGAGGLGVVREDG